MLSAINIGGFFVRRVIFRTGALSLRKAFSIAVKIYN